MTTHPKSQPNEPLRTWYPYLWTWAQSSDRERRSATRGPDDVVLTVLSDDAIDEMTGDNYLVKDLGGSLNDLTTRLSPSKRRPTPRLKQLALWNAALELKVRRAEAHESASAINSALKVLCTETHRLSDLLQPCDPETRIERELLLGCCVVGDQPRFNVTAPQQALDELRQLGLDAKDVFILRNSILALSPMGQDALSETLGVTRQTVWNRGKSLVSKLSVLADNETFSELAPIVGRYQRFPVSDECEVLVDSMDVVYDTRDASVGYLTSPASGNFPTYRDLWQILFFLSTADSRYGNVPFGFMSGDSGLHKFVGHEYYIFVQDLAPGDYDEENKPPDEPATKSKGAGGRSR